MANTNNTNQETNKYTTIEVVEGLKNLFCNGIKKDKNGKNVYFRQVKGDDGKVDKKKTKVAINLCLPASKDSTNEESKFIVAGVSLENASLFKESGIDLGVKSNTPIRVRYSIQDYSTKNEDGTYTQHTVREIVNVGTYDAETKSIKWVKVSKPAQNNTPETEEVSEDDLPF